MMDTAQARRQLLEKLDPQFDKGEAQAITKLLLQSICNWRTGQLTRPVSDEQWETLQRASERILGGEPVQYVLQEAYFYGRPFQVNPSVLIPRPETEELVSWILEHQDLVKPQPRMLDIGTGSGCIPITLAKEWSQAEIWGLDVSTAALTVATANAKLLHASVKWRAVDILQPADWPSLPTFDIIISNPPYIPEKERSLMPEHVLQHEPHLALFVDNGDPLIFYRHILQFARQHLSPGGWLFFETNEYNALQVDRLGEDLGFIHNELRQDLQGKWRMWRGRWPINVR